MTFKRFDPRKNFSIAKTRNLFYRQYCKFFGAVKFFKQIYLFSKGKK